MHRVFNRVASLLTRRSRPALTLMRTASVAVLLCACMSAIDGVDPDARPDVGGVIGALSTAPDSLCVGRSNAGHDYWFCSTPRTWQDARTRCRSIGYDLITINSSAENQFVASNQLGNTWTGGVDSAEEGKWVWTASAEQYWQGGSNGAAFGGAYVNWRAGQPDNLLNQDCAQFQGGLGGNKWTDENCSLLAAFICEGDLCPADPTKTEPGQCGCGIPDDDADGDGTANCLDQCPNDRSKTNSGVCGCGVNDGDSDGDGVEDCRDQCPADAKRILSGQCGCGNAPKPAGTSCSDGLCAANNLCDGAGSCGSAAQCGVPDSVCNFQLRGGEAYWVCDNARSQSNARQRCQNVGMDLALIDNAGESAFIGGKVHGQSFLGGSDQLSEGEWIWLHTGDKFWTGATSGHAVNGAFVNWDLLQPSNLLSTSDCLMLDPLLLPGKWDAVDCNSSHSYVCERIDLCPFDPNKLDPGVCGCGVSDVDTDGDGTRDCQDPCSTDANKIDPGICGCGVADIDTDHDGTADCMDGCPTDAAKRQPGVCGCGVADTDGDNDGALDCVDLCPDDPARVAPGRDGCADTLDQQASELTALKRLAADPSTPPGNLPSSMTVKLSAGQALQEAWRVIDSMPDDSTLHSEDDLRPYIVALGRAWSAIALIKTAPLGRLPGGQRCSDTLEGTSADPTRPLISALFTHLAYQDDDEQLTRAAYVLSDLQNLIHCSTRADLVRLDRGISSAFEAVTQRLVTQHKTLLAVAFHDHALPVALLLYDAGQSFYTPRAYRMLTARVDFEPRFDPSEPNDPGAGYSSFYALPESSVLNSVPFASTVSSYLYCDRPASHYTLSRFGIWLPDKLQGGRLSRVRLGGATICDFLSRITDFAHLGAGDCSLLQLAYSGYQCRSARTCNIAAPSLYRLGSRPGSSLSPLTHFGIPKTLARQMNCESPGTNDGLGGYGTQRPGTACLITGDDLIAQAQNPFLTCLVASQVGGAIEPPPDPWNNECAAIDCAEGEECEPEPPPEEEQPEQTTDPTDVDADGDTDDDDKHCNGQCEANGLISHKPQTFIDAMEKTFGPAHCPGCLVDGWQQVVADILSHPPGYVVMEHVNLNPGGYTGSSLKLGNTSPDGMTVSLDNTAIEQIAYDRAAKYHNLSTGACRVDTACASDALNKEYPVVRREALLHELGHVVFQEAIRGARTDVFSREAQSTIGYLGLFNWQWEDMFPAGTCAEDPAACSAVHDYIRHLLGGFNTRRSGRSCGVEGACSESCGADSLTKYQACDALADLIRAQYRNRIAPVCLPPAPNQMSIAAECRFPGCFGDGIQTARSACPFALCTGNAQLGTNIACDCCSMCDPAPLFTGYSPSCRDEPSCEQCCRWCNVGPAAQCPPSFTPTALEVPPAWEPSISPD